MQGSILLVEDETAACGGLSDYLNGGGFYVERAADCERASTVLSYWIPDLILLNWLVRGIDAAEWVRIVKLDSRYKLIPIIMFGARADEEDRIRAFDLGVEDFLCEPCSPPELLARVRAVLRRFRAGAVTKAPLQVSDIKLEPLGSHVYIGPHRLTVRPVEYRLLEFFLTHLESACSRSQIVEQVWDGPDLIDERTVDVHVMRLRRILASYGRGQLIQTVRGFGYRCSIFHRS